MWHEKNIYMDIRITDWIITRIYRRYIAYSLERDYRPGCNNKTMRGIQEVIKRVTKMQEGAIALSSLFLALETCSLMRKLKGGSYMKLKLFDYIALGISALGTILLGVSNMRHASESAVKQVQNAFNEAEEDESYDVTES